MKKPPVETKLRQGLLRSEYLYDIKPHRQVNYFSTTLLSVSLWLSPEDGPKPFVNI